MQKFIIISHFDRKIDGFQNGPYFLILDKMIQPIQLFIDFLP
jgi:hypothetical protein